MLELLFRETGPLPTVAQLSALREATCDYVDRAKADGERSEQVVIAVRAAAERSQSRLPGSVLDGLIVECVKRYFGTPLILSQQAGLFLAAQGVFDLEGGHPLN